MITRRFFGLAAGLGAALATLTPAAADATGTVPPGVAAAARAAEAGPSAESAESTVRAFRVGKVVTMDADDTVINNAVVLVRDGRIAAVGKASAIEIPDGAELV